MSSSEGARGALKEWIASSNDWKSAAKEELVNAFKAAHGKKTLCIRLPDGIDYSEYQDFAVGEFGGDIQMCDLSARRVLFAISKDELRRVRESSMHAHDMAHYAEMYG